MKLTTDEVAAFDRDGFVGPFTLVEPDTAERLATRVRDEVIATRSSIYAHSAPRKNSAFDYSVLNFVRDRHLDSPLLYRLASHRAIVDRVSSLLGPDLLLWRSDAFAQPERKGSTAPHQDIDFSAAEGLISCVEAADERDTIGTMDTPTGPLRLPLTVSAWIALTPVDSERGAMWVVPGSHKRGCIPEVPLGPGEKGAFGRQTKMDIDLDAAHKHTLSMAAGQFVLFSNLLVHASYPTEIGNRLAWCARYVAPRTRLYPRSTVNAQGQSLTNFGAVLVAGADHARVNRLRAAPWSNGCTIEQEEAVAELASVV